MKKEIKKTIITCDLCGSEDTNCINVNYPVIYTTSKTDGISYKPYIEQVEIDICTDCKNKVLKIMGYGAKWDHVFKTLT